jgi:hypothetical protein
MSFMAALTLEEVGLAKAGRLNILLKRGSGAADTTGPSTSAAAGSTSFRMRAPATPAAAPPTNLRRLRLLPMLGSQGDLDW